MHQKSKLPLTLLQSCSPLRQAFKCCHAFHATTFLLYASSQEIRLNPWHGYRHVGVPQKWVKARDEADFSQFAPVLQEWVDLLKKYATAIDSSRPIYDVLLDDFEKGMTSSRLDEIFTEVTQITDAVMNAVERVGAAQASHC